MAEPARATGPVVALVPLRDGTSGKSRLAGVLDAASRRRLVTALARHVVTTLLAVDAVERVVVVTADPAFARSALADLDGDAPRADGDVPRPDGDAPRRARLEVLEQPADRPGLDAALDVGREHVAADDRSPSQRPARLLVVHADLPALTPDDVAAVLAHDAPVVVATDRHAAGTNLLLLATPEFTFRFGRDSLAAHRAEAERRGLRAVVVRRPGTATDLDTLDDWGELPARVRDAVGRAVPALGTARGPGPR